MVLDGHVVHTDVTVWENVPFTLGNPFKIFVVNAPIFDSFFAFWKAALTARGKEEQLYYPEE
ncbi:hypothetical protein S245_052017, partial [Arachis hypogaea]